MPLSLAGIGKAYVRESKPEEAIPYLQRAVELEPDSANLHYQLGQAYLKANRNSAAERELAEAGRLQAKIREKQEARISGKLPPPQAPLP
jgi:Flp pilus assembly protein TadD